MTSLQGEESLPPAPQQYFNDAAGIVSPAIAQQFNQELAKFDQATSNQIVVAIYPQFFSNTSLDDLAQQLYSSWHLGTKKNSNGVLLLIFPTEHKIRIQTGYGLEGALPDAICKRIIDDLMAPAFRQTKYDQGLARGLQAIMKATQGEYQGTGPRKKAPSWKRVLFSPLGFFILFMVFSTFANWRRRSLGGSDKGGGWFIGGGGFGGGGGDGGFGGFSGGGGDSGGGGAGGGW